MTAHAFKSPVSAKIAAFFAAFGTPSPFEKNDDAIRHRQTVRSLQRLDERMLKDIGVERVDPMDPHSRFAAERIMSRQIF